MADPEERGVSFEFTEPLDARPAADSHDRSAPGVRLSLLPDEHAAEGTPLDLTDRVLGFTFEDSDAKADRATFELLNHDLELFDEEALAAGTILEVAWGYPGRMAPPRRVVIKKLKGFETLKIEAQALSVLLNGEAKTRGWRDRTHAQVVRAVAEDHGWGALAEIEETGEVLDTINQAGETDARFLARLAAREGFQFFIDDSGFHWHPKRKAVAPVHTFRWLGGRQGEVLSVQVESDLKRRVGKVVVRGRDPLTRATIEAEADAQSVNRPTLAEAIEVVNPDTGETTLEFRNATRSVHTTSAKTQAQAQAEANARFRRAETESVKLSLRVVGDPTLRAKTIVEVEGIGRWLSGKYYVAQVRHDLGQSGYLCQLKLQRDGTGRRARQIAREQGGERNEQTARPLGEPELIEKVDPETGATHLEFRGEGPPGEIDPEAMRELDELEQKLRGR